MKKRIGIVLAILLLCIIIFGPQNLVNIKFGYAAGEGGMTKDEIVDSLENGVNDQLGKIDFSDLDKLIYELAEGQKSLFGAGSFVEKIKALVSGDVGEDANSIFSVISSLLLDGCLKYLPLLATIVAIAVLSSMVNGARASKNKGVGEVVHFVCFGTIVVLLIAISADFLKSTISTLNLIKVQAEAVFPVLLTFIAAMGGSVSVKLYQPIVLIISNIILNIVTSILMPILVLIFVFAILGNLTKVVKFDKFASFLSSTFKWALGFTFTIFSAFLGIKGIMASTFDGISIKTAKYAVKSYIPLLGGYLSEGFDVILTSSLLIKNAVGATGILMLFATVIVPVLNLAIFNLFLKLAAGICEPICDSRISNFLYGISKIIPYLIACILACAFMYVLTLGFAMLTASTLL